ncbi:unnamed protein product, partial [Prorocentrum cordatum]
GPVVRGAAREGERRRGTPPATSEGGRAAGRAGPPGLSTPDQWPPMNRRFPSGQDGPGKAEKSHPVFHEGHASKTCPNHQRMLSPRAHRPDERARREAVLKSTDGGEDALKQIV